jgi:hypothetical protein
MNSRRFIAFYIVLTEEIVQNFLQTLYPYKEQSTYKAAPLLKRLVAGFPPRRSGFKPGSSHVGFVVDKVTLGQVFSEYFGFPCQSSFHQFLHNHHYLSSGAGTIGSKWPQYPKSHRTN